MSAATLLSVPVSETTAMQSENVSLSEMKSEVLIRNITDSLNSAMVATLKELEPYIREVWRRLDAGEAIQVRGGDGCTVTCDTRKTFCTLVLGKTYRAVHYMLSGGNPRGTAQPAYSHSTAVQPSEDDRPLRKPRELTQPHPERRKNRNKPIDDFEDIRRLALSALNLGFQQLKNTEANHSLIDSAKTWARCRLQP